jgi:hypothetical protein
MKNRKAIKSSKLEDGDLFVRSESDPDWLIREIDGDSVIWNDTGSPMYHPETMDDYTGEAEETVYLCEEE